MKGKLFILSGQSGVGKNTILKAVLGNHPNFRKAVTCTTREPRPEEIPGDDHYFVYPEKFQQMIATGELLEFSEVHGQMYGTPKKQIEDLLRESKNIIMEIDVQGARQIKKTLPEAVLIFIKYEQDDLENAIRQRIKNDPARENTSEEEINRRIATAQKEAEFEKYYDYSVVNPEGHPEKAIEEVERIMQKELHNENR